MLFINLKATHLEYFLDELEDILHTVYLSKEKCLIIGDININTHSNSKISKEYLNLFRSEGFNLLKFESRRITQASQSRIDHIHSNFAAVCTSESRNSRPFSCIYCYI